jgi:hypothetical protein
MEKTLNVPLWTENASRSFLNSCKKIDIPPQLLKRHITSVRITKGYEQSGLCIGEDNRFHVLLGARCSFEEQSEQLACAIARTFFYNITRIPPVDHSQHSVDTEEFCRLFAEKWLKSMGQENVITYIRGMN